MYIGLLAAAREDERRSTLEWVMGDAPEPGAHDCLSSSRFRPDPVIHLFMCYAIGGYV